MKIIIVDRLNYSFGGTQQYVFSLAKLLKQKNHQVKIFNGIKLLNIKNAKKIPNKSPKWNALSKIQTIYSLSILIRSIRFFKKYKPDLIHLNNINYQITPSIIHSAVICKIPIVYTLHDYKLICAKYTLKNNQNSYCQSCNQQNFISIIKKKCTLKNQKSRFETLFLFLESIFHHKTLKIYKHIDCFISPSYFLKETFKKMGFKHSISVIPNFTYPPNTNVTPIKTNKQTKFKIIYFGRFVVEKGLLTLCKTIKEIPINLSLVGSGPLYKKLKSISKQTRNHPQRSENIKVYPFMKKTKLFNLIKKHHFSIIPSQWPENASISVLESLSLGKPVIASNVGGIPEIIKHNKNGWLFESHNPNSLQKTLKQIISKKPAVLEKISQNALASYQKNYSPNIYYKKLIKIYKKAINKHA